MKHSKSNFLGLLFYYYSQTLTVYLSYFQDIYLNVKNVLPTDLKHVL